MALKISDEAKVQKSKTIKFDDLDDDTKEQIDILNEEKINLQTELNHDDYKGEEFMEFRKELQQDIDDIEETIRDLKTI